MALFNYASKELTLKIVYYGPGLSGKTTNIQHLHRTIHPEKRGKLLSLATETDRTLFFDFLPVDLGKLNDFDIRFQLYTVPGQIRYNSTRRLVLKGADAVVFVADSQREMKQYNKESLDGMIENLRANGLDPDQIPTLLQYNKRDLKNIMPVEELDLDLNIKGKQVFLASAVNGRGVEETFKGAIKILMDDLARKQTLQAEGAFGAATAQPGAKTEEAALDLEDLIERFGPDLETLPPAGRQGGSRAAQAAQPDKIPDAGPAPSDAGKGIPGPDMDMLLTRFEEIKNSVAGLNSKMEAIVDGLINIEKTVSTRINEAVRQIPSPKPDQAAGEELSVIKGLISGLAEAVSNPASKPAPVPEREENEKSARKLEAQTAELLELARHIKQLEEESLSCLKRMSETRRRKKGILGILGLD